MTDLWTYLQTVKKPILLYGTGNGADLIIDELERLDIRVNGVFASDGFVRKRTFRSFDVLSYSEAKLKFENFIVLVSFGSSLDNVIDCIKSIAAEQELYSVDVPVYGNNIFNLDFAQEHSKEIEHIYNSIYDDFSKRVFENIVMFKLTGKINYLFGCETFADEAYKNILKLTDDEIYMDLGAFNGDTVAEFISEVGNFGRIYALEPDLKNFKKLDEKFADYENIECMNMCVGNAKCEKYFSKHGGRNGTSDKNGTPVKCDTVDNILSGRKVTYIKADIEGAESEFIDGAKETIKNFRPKMLVSCYHRSEDIFKLPLKILSICPDYKVYIRHYRYIPAWDTQFYFV